MTPLADWPPIEQDDLDSLHVDLADGARIAEALAAECAAEDLAPADPRELPRYGRFVHGEEDPTIRRFLVAPAGPRWTTVLLSAPDWEHDWIPRLVARLRCRAAYLMLHDGDVFTLHLHGPESLLAAHVTSPVHFDRLDSPPSPALHRALESFACVKIGPSEFVDAVAPPGRIDVDGRLAFRRIARLLGIPRDELGAYRWALGEDRLTPRPEVAAWRHLGFALDSPAPPDDDEQAEAAGEVVPFGPRS